MKKKELLTDELVHLSRLALTGRRQDIQMYVKRLSKKIREENPLLADNLDSLLIESPSSTIPLRGTSAPMPVDVDSRLNLARLEQSIKLSNEPVWSDSVERKLTQIIDERQNQAKLIKADLLPSKATLFTGPPGVGKTLAARWIASRLNLPLVVLDLSAVMSRFLGKTGNNLRNVLDYAKSVPCVLLLDEFDSIAKKRDDDTEIGELKRIVTVLLQEIDDWPSSGFLIAATNHPELLDPAVWRRFDSIIEFELPSQEQILRALKEFIGIDYSKLDQNSLHILTTVSEGLSYSDIEKYVHAIKRSAVLQDKSIAQAVIESIQTYAEDMPKNRRIQLASALRSADISDREINRLTKVSRDTLRKKRTEA